MKVSAECMHCLVKRQAENIKKYSPDAWVINYTNPMTLCVKTLYRVFPEIKAFGCCHEVFGTQRLLTWVVEEFLGKLSHVGSGAFHIAQSAAHFKACFLHAVTDVEDLIGSQCRVGQCSLDGSEGAGQQSALLTQGGEVEAAAVFHIAHKR